MANGPLRTAMAIAERNGRETNWSGFREALRMSLEASHAAINALAQWKQNKIEKSSDEIKAVEIDYRNYRGERSIRKILPLSWRFGSSEYHKEPQWLVLAYDFDKKANREFAQSDISDWKPTL